MKLYPALSGSLRMSEHDCPADLIPDIQHLPINSNAISERAYTIWKRYGNADSISNYFQAEKELRMEQRLNEVFQLLDEQNRGECSFQQLLSFGNFVGVDWTPLYLRETFEMLDGNEQSIVNLSQFLRFTVSELNGLDLQLFNYIVEGFIVYTGFDKRMKEELQVCFTSMPSQKLNTISISDFLYLIDCVAPEKDRHYHLRVLSIVDRTRDGYLSRFEFFALLSLLLPISITASELARRAQMYINK